MLSGKEGAGTTVGAAVKLSGTLKDAADITVYGTVEGEVVCEQNVVVGETAKIIGPLTAKIVTVAGQVRGSIVAFEKLEILPSGKISGSITTDNLIIQSGAIFNGKCTMPASKEKEKTESKVEKETEKPIEPEKDEASGKTQKEYELE